VEFACNVTRQIPLLADLVNLATAQMRGGTRSPRLDEQQLVAAFAAQLSPAAAEQVRAVPDAGTRLAKLAGELRAAMVATDAAETASRINAMMRRFGAQPYLVEDVGQPFHLHFHGAGETAIEALGGEFATALALIVDGYGAERLGQCQAHNCEAVYVDTTRNGSRRYCGAACTARAKTAAYRSRRQT
jgi:predicted RNA-binding Zn ribbon-like protein